MSRSKVYKFHFWPPYKHAAHYSGRSDRLPQRLADHALGRGARLTQVQLKAGGSWVIGLIEDGGADRERQIKGHDAGRYCNVCKALKGYQAGKLTTEQALSRAGWDRASEYERGLLLEIFGIDQAEISAEKVPSVSPEPVVPQPRPEPVEPTPEIDALVDALIESWSPKAEPGTDGTGHAGPEPRPGTFPGRGANPQADREIEASA
jgi:hypothetical protein